VIVSKNGKQYLVCVTGGAYNANCAFGVHIVERKLLSKYSLLAMELYAMFLQQSPQASVAATFIDLLSG